jgi:putative membrane protein
MPWAQERLYDWGWGAHHPMWWAWGAGGVIMMLMMVIFWVTVITAIVIGVRWLVRQGRPAERTDAALDILRQRYARGEIDRQEFEDRRRDLQR